MSNVSAPELWLDLVERERQWFALLVMLRQRPELFAAASISTSTSAQRL